MLIRTFAYSAQKFFIALILTLAASGCGGEQVDVTKPVEVTDEMQRQAEAADKFFTDSSKTKKASN